MHRRLVGGDVGDAAGADDQHVALGHVTLPSVSVGVVTEAGSEVVVGELADHLDATVEAADGDRRHGAAPLNHDVLTIVYPAASANRTSSPTAGDGGQVVLAEHVAGQARPPGDDRAVVAGGRRDERAATSRR